MGTLSLEGLETIGLHPTGFLVSSQVLLQLLASSSTSADMQDTSQHATSSQYLGSRHIRRVAISHTRCISPGLRMAPMTGHTFHNRSVSVAVCLRQIPLPTYGAQRPRCPVQSPAGLAVPLSLHLPTLMPQLAYWLAPSVRLEYHRGLVSQASYSQSRAGTFTST